LLIKKKKKAPVKAKIPKTIKINKNGKKNFKKILNPSLKSQKKPISNQSKKILSTLPVMTKNLNSPIKIKIPIIKKNPSPIITIKLKKLILKINLLPIKIMLIRKYLKIIYKKKN
jgi:hypothetical protein